MYSTLVQWACTLYPQADSPARVQACGYKRKVNNSQGAGSGQVASCRITNFNIGYVCC